MKKIMMIFFAMLLFITSVGMVMAAEEDEEDEGMLDAVPELIVSLTGIVGVGILFFGTKDIQGVVGQLLTYLKFGFLAFTAAFLTVGIGELIGVEEGFVEILFEVFAMIGMLILIIGPLKLKKAMA